MRPRHEYVFPRLWHATSPDGLSSYEVTVRGEGAEALHPVPGMRLRRVAYRSRRYWRWWLTSNRFSYLDVVAILIIVNVLQRASS